MEEIDVFKLRKLTAMKKITKIGRMRSILDDIEMLIAGGVSYEKIVSEINDQGIEIKMSHFKKMLYRLRNERNKEKTTDFENAVERAMKKNISIDETDVVQSSEISQVKLDSLIENGLPTQATTKSIRAIFNSNVVISEFM